MNNNLLFVLWHLSTQLSVKTAIIGDTSSYKEIYNFLKHRWRSYHYGCYQSIAGINLGPIKPKSLFFLNIDLLENAICGFRFDSIILLNKMTKEELSLYIQPHLSTCENYIEIQEALRFEEMLVRANFFKSEWKFQRPKPTFFNLTDLT